MRKSSLFLLSILCCSLSSCVDSDGSQGFTGSQSSSTHPTSYPNLNTPSGSESQSSWSGPAGASTESDESSAKVEVCPGPDPFESNDKAMDAAPLVFNDGKLKARAGVTLASPDYFVFDAPRADPIQIRASYTPKPGDISDLTLFLLNASGVELARHDEPRKERQEVMEINFVAKGAMAPYYLKVQSNSESCTAYTLELDAKICSDEYEDNDSLKTAKPMPIDPVVPTELPGAPTVIRGDDDFYEIQAVGSDPIIVQAVYTPPSGDMTDLSMFITDAVGAPVGKHDTKRSEPTETMQVRFMPQAKNGVYRIQITSNRDRCMPYSLEVTPRSCSDAFEDNDNFSEAALLSEVKQEATITDVDPDYFRLEGLGSSGTCVVSYTVDEQSSEDLSLYLYSSGETQLTSHEIERTGHMESMFVHWNADKPAPAYLKVTARTSDCTSYRVSCTSDN